MNAFVPAGKIARGNLVFAWVNAAVFLFAALWGTLREGAAMPLAGLRQIAQNPWIAWPLALFVLAVAIQLSVARWRTRERLLFLAGALACTWIVLSLYVSPGPAIGLAILSGAMFRQKDDAPA